MGALRDNAMESALAKAINGKYRAAADVLAAAFPSQAKAFEKLFNTQPWTSKTTMTAYINALGNATEPAKGWSKKQAELRPLIGALSVALGITEAKQAEAITIEA